MIEGDEDLLGDSTISRHATATASWKVISDMYHQLVESFLNVLASASS